MIRSSLSHLLIPWCRSNITPFYFRVILNAYTTCTWNVVHLVKLQHLDLPYYLGLTLTSKQVGLILVCGLPKWSKGLSFRITIFRFLA